jgi:hypothetical protein
MKEQVANVLEQINTDNLQHGSLLSDIQEHIQATRGEQAVHTDATELGAGHHGEVATLDATDTLKALTDKGVPEDIIGELEHIQVVDLENLHALQTAVETKLAGIIKELTDIDKAEAAEKAAAAKAAAEKAAAAPTEPAAPPTEPAAATPAEAAAAAEAAAKAEAAAAAAEAERIPPPEIHGTKEELLKELAEGIKEDPAILNDKEYLKKSFQNIHMPNEMTASRLIESATIDELAKELKDAAPDLELTNRDAKNMAEATKVALQFKYPETKQKDMAPDRVEKAIGVENSRGTGLFEKTHTRENPILKAAIGENEFDAAKAAIIANKGEGLKNIAKAAKTAIETAKAAPAAAVSGTGAAAVPPPPPPPVAAAAASTGGSGRGDVVEATRPGATGGSGAAPLDAKIAAEAQVLVGVSATSAKKPPQAPAGPAGSEPSQGAER